MYKYAAQPSRQGFRVRNGAMYPDLLILFYTTRSPAAAPYESHAHGDCADRRVAHTWRGAYGVLTPILWLLAPWLTTARNEKNARPAGAVPKSGGLDDDAKRSLR